MKKVLFICIFFFATISIVSAKYSAADDNAIIGRWDLTVTMGDRIAPSWLEVKLSGVKTLVGYFVAEGGSARPIALVNFKEGKVSFSIPPQWERIEKDMVFEGVLDNDQLKGTITSSYGKSFSFVGERAPLLKRTAAPIWGKPIKLIKGNTLVGWHASGTTNQWLVINGVLTNPKSGSNIITDQKFEDFKLHVEFRYPAGSNSGVYLRGRHEVQIEDNKGKEPSSTYFGGVYGFLTPNEMVAKAPGEWQTYDITLIGRRVTIIANGKAIIVDQIIPGITGGALDSKEGEPGPIYFQGDHGPIEYKNIVITPAKKIINSPPSAIWSDAH
jgi:hypothetical protein